ncbi:MAG: hypothetical protein HY548_01460, partial [Elusimicrobia bacterium]|nr:hypothetical protein [Elusimicrobiota bacterium]
EWGAGEDGVIAALFHKMSEGEYLDALKKLPKEARAPVEIILRQWEAVRRVPYRPNPKSPKAIRGQIIRNQMGLIVKMAGSIDPARAHDVLRLEMADKLQELTYASPAELPFIYDEIVDLYAPLAERLGREIWASELRDEALRLMESDKYRQVQSAFLQAVNLEYDQALLHMESVRETVEARLREAGVKARVLARVKGLKSMSDKLQRKGKDGRLPDTDLFGLMLVFDPGEELDWRARTLIRELLGPETLTERPNAYRPPGADFITNRFYVREEIAEDVPVYDESRRADTKRIFEVQMMTHADFVRYKRGKNAHWKYEIWRRYKKQDLRTDEFPITGNFQEDVQAFLRAGERLVYVTVLTDGGLMPLRMLTGSTAADAAAHRHVDQLQHDYDGVQAGSVAVAADPSAPGGFRLKYTRTQNLSEEEPLRNGMVLRVQATRHGEMSEDSIASAKAKGVLPGRIARILANAKTPRARLMTTLLTVPMDGLVKEGCKVLGVRFDSRKKVIQGEARKTLYSVAKRGGLNDPEGMAAWLASLPESAREIEAEKIRSALGKNLSVKRSNPRRSVKTFEFKVDRADRATISKMIEVVKKQNYSVKGHRVDLTSRGELITITAESRQSYTYELTVKGQHDRPGMLSEIIDILRRERLPIRAHTMQSTEKGIEINIVLESIDNERVDKVMDVIERLPDVPWLYESETRPLLLTIQTEDSTEATEAVFKALKELCVNVMEWTDVIQDGRKGFMLEVDAPRDLARVAGWLQEALEEALQGHHAEVKVERSTRQTTSKPKGTAGSPVAMEFGSVLLAVAALSHLSPLAGLAVGTLAVLGVWAVLFPGSFRRSSAAVRNSLQSGLSHLRDRILPGLALRLRTLAGAAPVARLSYPESSIVDLVMTPSNAAELGRLIRRASVDLDEEQFREEGGLLIGTVDAKGGVRITRLAPLKGNDLQEQNEVTFWPSQEAIDRVLGGLSGREVVLGTYHNHWHLRQHQLQGRLNRGPSLDDRRYKVTSDLHRDRIHGDQIGLVVEPRLPWNFMIFDSEGHRPSLETVGLFLYAAPSASGLLGETRAVDLPGRAAEQVQRAPQAPEEKPEAAAPVASPVLPLTFTRAQAREQLTQTLLGGEAASLNVEGQIVPVYVQSPSALSVEFGAPAEQTDSEWQDQRDNLVSQDRRLAERLSGSQAELGGNLDALLGRYASQELNEETISNFEQELSRLAAEHSRDDSFAQVLAAAIAARMLRAMEAAQAPLTQAESEKLAEDLYPLLGLLDAVGGVMSADVPEPEKRDLAQRNDDQESNARWFMDRLGVLMGRTAAEDANTRRELGARLNQKAGRYDRARHLATRVGPMLQAIEASLRQSGRPLVIHISKNIRDGVRREELTGAELSQLNLLEFVALHQSLLGDRALALLIEGDEADARDVLGRAGEHYGLDLSGLRSRPVQGVALNPFSTKVEREGRSETQISVQALRDHLTGMGLFQKGQAFDLFAIDQENVVWDVDKTLKGIVNLIIVMAGKLVRQSLEIEKGLGLKKLFSIQA